MEWSIFNCSLVTDTIRLTKMVEQHKCIRDRKCQKFILGSKTGNVRNGEGIRNWKYPKQSVSELKVSVKKTHPKRAFLSRCFVLFRPFLLSGSLNCKPVVSETFQFFFITLALSVSELNRSSFWKISPKNEFSSLSDSDTFHSPRHRQADTHRKSKVTLYFTHFNLLVITSMCAIQYGNKGTI